MWMTKYTLDTSAQPGGGGNDNDLHKTLKKTWIIAPQADAGHALA